MTHPYFIIPDIEALATAPPEQRAVHMRRIAANIGDEVTLRRILGIDPREFAKFYPDMEAPELSTSDTIDSFIDTYSSESRAATPTVEEIVPAAPVYDYAATLEEIPEDEGGMEDATGDATGDAIDSFLKAVPPKKPQKKAAPEPAPSISLFKQLVKERQYSSALQIIKKLNLNNPEKSVYFAYQIRFLEKLIKNQENNRL